MNFTLRVVPDSVQRLLAKAELSLEQIDLFVFHQANQYMLDYLRKKMKIAPEKFCIEMKHHGNTSCASIPLALKMAMADGAPDGGEKSRRCGIRRGGIPGPRDSSNGVFNLSYFHKMRFISE